MVKNDISQEEFDLSLLRAGDPSEFTRFVELYEDRIYHLALRMLGNEQDAEDVLQETFLKAFRGLPLFEGKSALSTWLYRIAANEALMLLRKRKPETLLQPEDSDEEEEETPEVVDWCCLPEAELVTTETRQKLTEAADHLSPNLKVVFLLRDIEGLSVKDTAEVLGLNESVVKTRLLRARMKLRQELSRYFGVRMVGEGKND